MDHINKYIIILSLKLYTGSLCSMILHVFKLKIKIIKAFQKYSEIISIVKFRDMFQFKEIIKLYYLKNA